MFLQYQYNIEYAVKSGSTSVIVCAWIKISTDGNSKTVQKFGKTLLNIVPIVYQYNVEYAVKSGSILMFCARMVQNVH